MYYEEPYEDVLNSLREIEDTFTINRAPKDWNFVRLHLGTMDKLKKNSKFFYDVFEFILRLFTLYPCTDFSIIADLFQLECFIFEYSSKSLKKAKTMTNILIKGQKCCEIDGLNFVAKLMKMPYKRHNMTYNVMYDVIQMHILSVEDKTLKYMFEYGVMYFPLNDHSSTWTNCLQRMSILLDDSDKKYISNLSDIQEKIKDLSLESRQRMLAVFRGVEVILKARCPKSVKAYCPRTRAVDLGLCFRMAYQTIPEPIITSKEVVCFLKCVLSGPSVDTLIEAIRKDYEKLFPESCEPLAPRTLEHLSRCEIRQCLRQKGCFPWGLAKVDLPMDMKDLIVSAENEYMFEQYDSYSMA